MKIIPTKEELLLAEKIWIYLNGRYEYYFKETKTIAKMIHKFNKKRKTS